MKISVVIQTYNSEQFLERVLNSVKEFDEIVVCDMYSTDRTIEIARKFDCKIVYHKKTDFCEPARNFAIHSATYDWVLVVDSDEIVPADLKDLPGKDVCICPSTRDASPRSLREAMACKVACIVTDIPGARDLVVDGRTGIIVQAGSPQAIAEGIRVLAADRAKTKMMGEAGYQRIRTDYTMEEYVRRLKGVFDAIMTK